MRLRLILLLAAIPLAAHHSTRAAFDDSKLVAMQGTVTEVRWLNPHGRFFMDVIGADGSIVNWEIELPSPNGLIRQGWKRSDLKAGDHVTSDVWLARTVGHKLATMRSLTLPDGRVFSGKTGWDNPIKIQ